jgi:formylglycine-generating enzyme required for sulfatase activity
VADHIFISYAREDQSYARELRDELTRRGFEVWLDDRIDAGDRWWQTIVEAIRASAALVVVMTPEAEDSEWVEREILLALDEKKPVFPLLLRGKRFPIFISTQYTDVSGDRLPPDWFYQGLARVVPTKAKEPSPQLKTETAPARAAKPKITAPSEPEPESKRAIQPQILSPRQPFEPEMILIPAGEFLMGSDPEIDQYAVEYEQPQHTVYLPDYYIAKTPVTNAQYAVFVKETNHSQPDHWKKGQPPRDKQGHPVVDVSWQDAVAYCYWLTKKTGRTYQLPTEAEWEKAARGTDGRIYPWGNQWDAKRCNTDESGKDGTTPVRAYPDGASPYGLLDIAGNVWEWCATKWKKSYPYDVTEDEWTAEYLEGSGVRVLRGGSWGYDLDFSRCACRGWRGRSYYGFRLVSPI